MAHVRLRRDRFERRAHELGLDTQSRQAAAIGTNETTHSRVLAGERSPGVRYVLGALHLLGDDKTRKLISELFDVPTAKRSA